MYSAVRGLLTDPRVAGQKDAVRLAAVVLLAKSPAASTKVRTRTGDLSRWLGCSASHVAHAVLPEVKTAGIATSEARVDDDGSGRVAGLTMRLLPLSEARAHEGDHPLKLTRRDLATLLRLCEAVIGPGWAPKDGPVTPAGLLADRRGRGAATDRLALLLLVLQTRADGRVRMVGGSVAAGRGRADATVARALGCSVSGGAKVVDRLEARGLLTVPRGDTASGCFGRARMWVPAVAEAHGRAVPSAASVPEVGAQAPQPAADSAVRCQQCAADDLAAGIDGAGVRGNEWVQGAFEEVLVGASGQRPVAASGDLEGSGVGEGPAGAGIRGAGGVVGGAGAERPVAADLHATHPQVVGVSPSSAGELVGCSGSAVDGRASEPECARTGEDQKAPAAPDEATVSGGGGGPLRGEQHSSQAIDSFGSARAACGAVFVRPSRLPEDLSRVLRPVAGLWAGVGRVSTQRWLAGAVRSELARLRGLVGAEPAEQVLVQRLERRLGMQAGRPVGGLEGWLLRRGLPQKPGCWSHLCDDGVRIDTGSGCSSCESVMGDRRALRASVASEVADDVPELPLQARRREVERRLQERVQVRAAAQGVRRERSAAEQAVRQEVLAARREELDAAERERVTAPCEECGIPEAAGLCLVCVSGRRTRDLLRQAVDVIVAVRADLDDPAATGKLAEQVAADTRRLLEDAVARSVDTQAEAVLAYTRATIAEQILAGRRASALARLVVGEEAEAEADRAYEAAMRRRHRYPTRSLALRAAEEAAERAGETAARTMLRDRLARLEDERSARPPASEGWERRCAELARRTLPGESPAAVGAADLAEGLVSAA
ncbi:hypothetical protein [Streptomyces sp. MMBL 11-1]|uniref:hypothetical protein n=1 Tax=Streptomyces sp. MMBL 11-1 TaxID=3026420 RepID=UPI002362938B|nr:hypothetical protein [Streptomyces sp. MMBL 11-1]